MWGVGTDVPCAIGVAFATGDKVPQDFSRAVDFYRKAAEKDYAPALMLLGMAYDEGKGVPKSHAEALKWYRKAADAGEAYAQLAIGNAH